MFNNSNLIKIYLVIVKKKYERKNSIYICEI